MKEKLNEIVRKKETYYIIGSMAACILLLLLVILPATRANISGEFPVQTVDTLSFQNGKLKIENGKSIYTVDVFNTKSTEKKVSLIEMHFKNEEGKEIALLYGYIGDKVGGKETKLLTASIDRDIHEATSIEYILK